MQPAIHMPDDWRVLNIESIPKSYATAEMIMLYRCLETLIVTTIQRRWVESARTNYSLLSTAQLFIKISCFFIISPLLKRNQDNIAAFLDNPELEDPDQIVAWLNCIMTNLK